MLSGGQPDVQDWQIAFRQTFADAAREGVELVIIDTISMWKPEVIAAHLLADLVITTVTESPVDLYQIMPSNGPNMQASRPYSQLIDLVRRHAEKANKDNFNWFMCLNRKSHLRTKIGESVRDRLQDFCDETEIQLIEGLVDRVGYRIMMETGITPIDEQEDQPVQRSLLAARTESRRLASQAVASLGMSVLNDQMAFS